MEWARSECGKYRIESLSATTMAGALDVIRNGFCKDGASSIGTEVNINPVASEELVELCADAALDGVSIVAVDTSTGKVVSAGFNKLQVAPTYPSEKYYFEVFAEKRCTQSSSKALINRMASLNRRCYLFEQYKTDCTLELMFLSTLRQYRQKKIGLLLCKTFLDLGRKLKYGPVSQIAVQDLGPKYAHMKPRKVISKVPTICHAISTSVTTQKVAKTLGFTTHLRVPLAESVYDGKTFVDRLGFDPYCEVIARRLD